MSPPFPSPPKQATDPGRTVDTERYSRQILFAGVGAEGQERLAGSHVAVVGVGATGAAAASLLARAGVGCLTLIDRDIVEPSNLQRQILFREEDAEQARPKAEAARAALAAANSAIEVRAHIADLVPGNIDHLLAGAHLLLDCTDNYETRYLLNDFAVREGLPWIYAGAVGSYAATMNILPSGAATGRSTAWQPSACLACLFPAPPTGLVETCDTAGILGMAVNFVASLQAAEALKFLTGQPHLMRRSLLSYDLWSARQTELNAATPDPACLVCGAPEGAERPFRFLAGAGRPHITLCGRNSVQIHEHARPLDLSALHARLLRQPDLTGLRCNPLLLRFQRGPHTVTVFPDGRALIQGTTDPALARSIYARFLGS